MFVLRCTKKLLSRMNVRPPADAPKSQTLLGDWYANLLHIQRQQLILCVSERTLLPVVMPARNARDLPQRLPLEIANVLRALDIPVAAITT